jgi:hypothetical protein
MEPDTTKAIADMIVSSNSALGKMQMEIKRRRNHTEVR